MNLKYFALLVLVILLPTSCIKTSSIPTSQSQPLPSESPVDSIRGYLTALKKRDFNKAYKYLSLVYAKNLDVKSYKINMENLVKQYDYKLENFDIKGVSRLGDQAYIAVDLEVNYNSAETGQKVSKKTGIRYILFPIDDFWKITSDSCIENCEEEKIMIKK
ncbi:MAG: hypothetical protein V3U54_02505 [Thermodesulfobacteriota bacterium]